MTDLKRFSLIATIIITLITFIGVVWAGSGRLTRIEEKANYNEKGIDRNYDEIIIIKGLILEMKKDAVHSSGR